jgi:hypothetical protein
VIPAALGLQDGGRWIRSQDSSPSRGRAALRRAVSRRPRYGATPLCLYRLDRYARSRSRRLPRAAAKIIATVVMPRIAARVMMNEVSASRTPSVETELADCRAVRCLVGRASEPLAAGFLVGAAAGAPYEGEVAIAVRFSATLGSVPRSAVLAVADSADLAGFPVPLAWPPPLVGTVSTYWEIEDAGPSPAAAGCGRLRTAPVQTRHQIPT